MGELRLRYVELMRDANSCLGNEDAKTIIKESEVIWEKLSNLKSIEQ